MIASNSFMVSFIIPAHNEEALLGRTLESISLAARKIAIPFEIIVVDDASEDQTAEIARTAGATVVSVQLRQISAVRNAGARCAKGDVLIFVDADTVLPPRTLQGALKALDRGAVGGGAMIDFDDKPAVWSGLLIRMWCALSRAMHWAAGCFVFVRRDAFEQVGGFDENYFAGEEIVLSDQLKRLGYFVILRESVVTSGRKIKTHGLAETLRLGVRLLIAGPGGWQRREGLDYWYNRRDEPAGD